jgi:predicted  nucleic acid-binding Zn-ribbon protein
MCPKCGASSFIREESEEESVTEKTRARCTECAFVFTMEELDTMALENQGVGRRDAWLIAAFIEQSRQSSEEEIENTSHQRSVLIELSRRYEGALHSADPSDFEEPVNRPGRTLDRFLQFANED